MGIDGIGGKPPIGPNVGSNSAVPRSGESFSLERPDQVAVAESAAPVTTPDALERLQAGELSLDEYMDTRVEKAVAHLSQVLPADQLQLLKEQLKEQLQHDPTLEVLLKRATGLSPAELDDNG